MLKRLTIILFLLLVSLSGYSQDLARILESKYSANMISSGKNYPTINIYRNNLDDILILLHNRISLKEIKKHYSWSDNEFQTKLNLLLEDELIKKDEEFGYLPTVMVISLRDGEKIREETELLAEIISKIIIKKLPEIKKKYAKISCSKNIEFSRVSLLILSNVLLDNWQINIIEEKFLKSKRTPRNNMNYYYSLQEMKKGDKKEAFGIYGNSSQYYGTILDKLFVLLFNRNRGILFSLYGNERQRTNFNTLTKEQFKKWFGIKESKDKKKIKKELLIELIKLSDNPDYVINDIYKKGFNKINMMKGNKLSVPVFDWKDNEVLYNIANIITNDIINLLEKN
ncbi:hypothetical protein KAU33_16855 [Candidatus Dependentiae bacterium]|nr:hypothetical protein [Candidatus Dependentiae bacterium]